MSSRIEIQQQRSQMPMEAVQIVEPKAGGTFILNKAALNKILLEDQRVANKKVAVFAIVGKYRQGKSFLMNFALRYLKHLESKSTGDWRNSGIPFNGFEFRKGPAAHTKGIWMWPEPFVIRNNNGEEVAVLLMDCQGLHDPETKTEDNGLLFALTALTSSTIIYNMDKNIGQDCLHDLQFFGNYGKMIMNNSQGQDHKPFQSLIFMVRDWQSPDEMEYGFTGGKHLLEQNVQKNIDRELQSDINRLFSSVDAFLMPNPGEAVSMGRFARLNDINEEFREYGSKFVEDIFSADKLKPKEVNGKAVTGRELSIYLNAYFSVYEDGKVPPPMSVYQATVNTNNLIAMSKALAYYNEEMLKLKMDDIDSTGLENRHEEVQADVCSQFKFMGGDEVTQRCKSELLKEMEDIYTTKYLPLFQAAQKQKADAEEKRRLANEKRTAEREAAEMRAAAEKKTDWGKIAEGVCTGLGAGAVTAATLLLGAHQNGFHDFCPRFLH